MKILCAVVLLAFVFIPVFCGTEHISPFSESVETRWSPWAIGFVTGLVVDVLLLIAIGLACIAWSMISCMDEDDTDDDFEEEEEEEDEVA